GRLGGGAPGRDRQADRGAERERTRRCHQSRRVGEAGQEGREEGGIEPHTSPSRQPEQPGAFFLSLIKGRMPTIEESLKLDLHRLIKGGTIVPGARSVGKLGFADTNLVIVPS